MLPKTNLVIITFLLFSLFACNKVQVVDLIVINGHIQTVDSQLTVCEAMAIKDGKIIALGTNISIQNKYKSAQFLDLKRGFVYPGFYDAHCHFYGYASNLLTADLYTCKSEEDLASCVARFAAQNPNQAWILGRGWDQTRWPGGAFPTKQILDSLFPNKPVLLTRIDGHAALVNQLALDLAGINENTIIPGGEVVLVNGKPSGLLIDMAIETVKKLIPNQDPIALRDALLRAQATCFSMGLTSLTDAGLPYNTVKYLDSLQKADDLQIKLNIMLEPSEENYQQFAKNGIYKTPRMQVNSFKLYGDGALGSRGAFLLQPYSDAPQSRGFTLYDSSFYAQWATKIAETKYQMNTHCIGDAATNLMLNIYEKVLADKPNRRWRIEHAQVVQPADRQKMGKLGVVASVQPTHATSDMRWAALRLGNERIHYAYAYKDLLDACGIIANGSDFPVEDINPLFGFHAAISRTDAANQPQGGWFPAQKINRLEALKAMTIWAAWACFEDLEKGSLEPGKAADWVVLPVNLLNEPAENLRNISIIATYIDGKEVYRKNK